MRFLPTLAAGLALLAVPARAEEPPACAAAILTLADTVLAGRSQLPKLKARGLGAEAAYLKIRYGGLSPEEASALAGGLREAGVREAVDLAGAVDAWRGGLAAVTTEPADLGGLISTLRAVLEHGDADPLLAAVAALPPERRVSAIQRIVPAVLDWPDERKAALAATARKYKLAMLESGLAATMRDPDGWADFAAAFPEPAQLADLAQVWHWAPGLVGNPALPRPEPQDAGIAASRRAVHAVWTVVAQEPERDFLMTYLNQTGDIAASEAATKAVQAALDEKKIRPDGRFDDAWLTAYRALRAASVNPAVVDGTLDVIPFYSTRYLRPTGDVTIRGVIDRLLAVEALTPYLKGAAGDLPAMPAELTGKFQPEWPLWTEIAGLLKTAPLIPLAKDPGKAPVVAELLFAAGDAARLTDFLAAVEPLEAQLAMATDFSMRLDRGCRSTTHHPGEALMLSGQPIFRFDAAK